MRQLSLASGVVLLFSSVVLPTQTPAKGGLEGTIIRSGTREPIPDVYATLSSADNQPAIVVSAKSDGNGKFAFDNLFPGAYRLVVNATGFVKQQYGQHTPYGQGRLVFVSAGRIIKDATISLTPFAIVRGRVLDDKNQIAPGASVQLLRVVYNERGKSYRAASSSVADDRGEYRLFDVPPGRYLLWAGTAQGPNFNSSSARYNLVFYPDTENIEQASPLNLTPGSEVAVDMRVRKRLEAYRVRGRLIDPSGKPLPDRVSIGLIYQSYGTGGGFAPRQTFDPATGVFELLNVEFGSWVASTMILDTALPPIAGIVDADTVRARLAESVSSPLAAARIRVTDSDIEVVLLTLQRGATTKGQVLVEGQPISSITNLNRIRLDFIPAQFGNDAPVATPPATDGTFEVRGLREGEYRLVTSSMIPGFYVKSLRYGSDNLLVGPLRLPATDYKSFEMELRATAAQIRGTVADALSLPVPGIQVFLVPEMRDRSDLYRTATTDPNGRFSLISLPPGDYKVFSWDSVDEGAQYDPDFLMQYDMQGTPVHIEESSNLDVGVQLIP